jgi:hypothetical protein
MTLGASMAQIGFGSLHLPSFSLDDDAIDFARDIPNVRTRITRRNRTVRDVDLR